MHTNPLKQGALIENSSGIGTVCPRSDLGGQPTRGEMVLVVELKRNTVFYKTRKSGGPS